MSEIGLKRGTVKLVPHSREWGELFPVEKVELLEALGDLVVDIQHVGSTAVPTISAKPIIDIAILVRSLKEVEKRAGRIEALGYQKKQENKPERLFFTKGPDENRMVYLHVGDESTEYIKDMIIFRDYLIQNPHEAEKYMQLKKELAEKFEDNRESYTAAKEKFVQEVGERVKMHHDIYNSGMSNGGVTVSENMKKGTTFVILRPDNTMLMQLRDDKSKLYPNMWCFPGGGCEENEEPIDTVIREAREEYELRLDKQSCKFLFVQPHPAFPGQTEYIFLCSIDSNQRPVLKEGADMKWMMLDEIKSTQLGFGDETIIPKLEEFLQARQ
jgi:GrpB-like predicted nucleotidyltransferase (UPF0157 family)/8-oxo-dGTP pyrophosphatase MutT (NUDIX family)